MSNKLIDNSNEPQVLKIVHGNDFSLHVYVTQWNAETQAWDYYDLSDTKNLDFYLVSTNFKRIKLDYVMQSDGSLLVDVISNYLQTTTYGLELTWLANNKNRRTYTPLMLQIVKSTPEADTDIEEYQNSVYDLNIRITNDINMIRIGGHSNIPDEDIATKQYIDYYCYSKDYIDDYYYDKGDVDNMLTSYINETDLQSALDAFDAEIASEYIDHNELDEALSYFTTTDDLQENFATKSYVTNAVNAIDLSDFPTYTYIESQDFATESYVSNAVNAIDLSDFPTYAYIESQDFATESYVSNAVNAIDLSDFPTYAYIESQDFASETYVTNAINGIDMSSYITSDELDAMGYITVDDIPELPDTSGFITNEQLSNMSYVTSSALSNMGYITAQDVPSIDTTAYVTHTELNNCGYITINDVPTPDLSSYVTHTELNNAGYITINDVPTVDTSAYVTHTELNNASYATESYVATNYAAKTDVPVNGIKFVNDSPIAVSYLWAGTNAELALIQNKYSNTLYITTDDSTSYIDLTPYALKSQVPKVVTLTQDQYNALIAGGPVDEQTIYLIIEQQ